MLTIRDRKKFLIMRLLIVFTIPLPLTVLYSYAVTSYYADVDIEVDNAGISAITGTTNHPQLQTGTSENFTSKQGSFWLLNVSVKETFSVYVYSIKLPENAVINYLKTSSQVRIQIDSGKLTIHGTGENEAFSLLVQYSISPKKRSYYLVVYGVTVLLLGLVYYVIKQRKKLSIIKEVSSVVPLPKYNPATLTERQRLIVELLKKSKNPVTQKTLENELKLPKSALSRNIESLVRKGILKKEKKGISNIISFNQTTRSA